MLVCDKVPYSHQFIQNWHLYMMAVIHCIVQECVQPSQAQEAIQCVSWEVCFFIKKIKLVLVFSSKFCTSCLSLFIQQ